MKRRLTKKVSKSPAFKKGVGAQQWAEREKQRKDGETLETLFKKAFQFDYSCVLRCLSEQSVNT